MAKLSFLYMLIVALIMLNMGYPVNIWYDDFESIYTGSEAWTLDADWNAGGVPYNGTYALFSSDSGTTSYATHPFNNSVLDTTLFAYGRNFSEYTNWTITFWANTINMDAGEGFSFSYWNGTEWNTTLTALAPTTYTYYTINFPKNMYFTNFKLNFTCIETGSGAETCAIDDLRLFAMPDPEMDIILNSPMNNSVLTYNNVNFSFNISTLIYMDYVNNCSLYINGLFNMTNQTYIGLGTNYINKSAMENQSLNWSIGCKAFNSTYSYMSKNFSLTIAKTYPGETEGICTIRTDKTEYADDEPVIVYTNSSISSNGILATTDGGVINFLSIGPGENVFSKEITATGAYYYMMNCTDDDYNFGTSYAFFRVKAGFNWFPILTIGLMVLVFMLIMIGRGLFS